MNYKVTVIIPAYNIQEFIGRCLDSVLGQTYRNLEIIVVNDGSKDNTLKVLGEYNKIDDRLIIVNKINGGVSSARNSGLKIATGKYICFVDGDDTIEADMIKCLMVNALKYNADISHCGYRMVYPSKQVDYYNSNRLIEQSKVEGVYDLLKGDTVEPGVCNKLYTKSMFNNINFDECIKINEDLLINYYLFKESNKSVFHDIVKYNYILRENSAATSRINLQKLNDPLIVTKKILADSIWNIRIHQVAKNLYVNKLIYMYTYNKNHLADEDLNDFKEICSDIKKLMKQYILDKDVNMVNKMKLLLTIINKTLYRNLKMINLLFKGETNKYEVK